MIYGEEAFSDWNVLPTESKQGEGEQAKTGHGLSGFLERGKAHFYNLYQRSVPSTLKLSPSSDLWLLGTRYPPSVQDRTEQVLAHLSVRWNSVVLADVQNSRVFGSRTDVV